jgi:hypothetical protein
MKVFNPTNRSILPFAQFIVLKSKSLIRFVMMKIILIPFFAVMLFASSAFGQRSVRDSTLSFVSISPYTGIQNPFGDLQKRYGYGGVVGANLSYKNKKNWMFDAQYGYLFGRIVKEDSILKNVLTSQGFVLNKNASPAEVILFERGFIACAKIGKIIPVFDSNPNSGIHIGAGAGLFQHRIKIQETSQSTPQILGDYAKGYDRLTNGFMLAQSFGYSHFSDYKLINYFIGVEFFEGFTENRRTVNYDTGLHDATKRIDIFGSVVIRWYFPIYKRKPQDFYFY